jgi:WD40 repeat protein
MVVAGADRKLRCTQARVPAGLRLVAAHQAPLRCVDVSHDGQQAVSVAGDRVARIWELETGRCVQTLEPAPDDVLAACFAPDGRSVWVGCRDGTVARADLGSQELRRIIEHPEATLRCLTLCPEAGLAVGGTEQGSVLFWDLAKGKSKGRASLGSTPPAYVALSRDGQRLVIAGDGQQLLLVHLQTRTIGKSQGTHSGPVSALALSADGTWLVSGGLDGTVMLWDFATGQCLTKLDGHSGPVRALALGSDNAWFASGGVDGVIRIWELLWDLHF